jgi:hypothetical protein
LALIARTPSRRALAASAIFGLAIAGLAVAATVGRREPDGSEAGTAAILVASGALTAFSLIGLLTASRSSTFGQPTEINKR